MIEFQLLPRGSPKAPKVKHAEVVPNHSRPAPAAQRAAPRDHISFLRSHFFGPVRCASSLSG